MAVLKSTVTILASLLLLGCGSQSMKDGAVANQSIEEASSQYGDTGTTTPTVLTGIFLDSAVEGIDYASGNTTGTTDGAGTFQYEEGGTVAFSVGGVSLGSSQGGATVTPVDLVPGGNTDSDAVVNIARFLQTLDADGDPSNGITVPEAVKSVLQQQSTSVDFSVDPDDFESRNSGALNAVKAVPLEGGNPRTVPSEAAAKGHLEQTLAELQNACRFNDETVANGDTVTAYFTDTVDYGDICTSETRTCLNGTLSGSYEYSGCTVLPSGACLFNGETVPNGNAVTAYLADSVESGSTCNSETRTCTDGFLSGSYAYANCTVSCTFNGQVISHGNDVVAYLTQTVAYGSTCTLENRTCTSGTLSGSYEYSSCQVQPWTQQLGTSTSDGARGVATDSSGNVYIVGVTKGELDGNTNEGDFDFFISKYNEFGEKQWAQQMGTLGEDYALGVATDSSGNIYVTGYTFGNLDGNTNEGEVDLFLVKYSASGIKQWTQQMGTTKIEIGSAVATDSNGDIYVTGYTQGGIDGNTNFGETDLLVVKYNTSGEVQWIKQLGTTSYDSGDGVTIDSNGNIYVVGRTGGGLAGNSSEGDTDLFLIKYDTSGVRQWVKQLGTTEHDSPDGVATDSDGNIYITGNTRGVLDGDSNAGGLDFFVAKYNSSGEAQWIKQMGDYDDDTAEGVATDTTGNIYITGTTLRGDLDGNTGVGAEDFFLIKYNNFGERQWTKQLGTSAGDYSAGVATDSNGNIYVVGSTVGGMDGNTNAGGADVFLIRYDAGGNKQ